MRIEVGEEPTGLKRELRRLLPLLLNHLLGLSAVDQPLHAVFQKQLTFLDSNFFQLLVGREKGLLDEFREPSFPLLMLFKQLAELLVMLEKILLGSPFIHDETSSLLVLIWRCDAG
jgi:hypothetical protein